jgi:predicted phage baseplate assembly protein
METELFCREERRRAKVREDQWNGFDFVEIEEIVEADGKPAGVQLRVYLLGNDPDGGPSLDPCQFVIDGGRRVPRVEVHTASYERGSKDREHERTQRDDTIILSVDRPNDLSTYTLRLVRDPHRATDDPDLFDSFDPRYASINFSFAAGCASDLDCAPQVVCPPEPLDEPPIDYLARDYSALRRLLLDRLALIMPEWKRRAVPDLAVALVELLAYTGDRISYHQDAVATEAYLYTARKRISLRRHARLVDYLMHEGCNARAFVCLGLGAGSYTFEDPRAISFLTAKPSVRVLKGRTVATRQQSDDPLAGREVFKLVDLPAKNELCAADIYDWPKIVRIVREMIAFSPSKKQPEKRRGGKHVTTLEKAWPLLPKETRTKFREEHLEPGNERLQATFDTWIKARKLWPRIETLLGEIEKLWGHGQPDDLFKQLHKLGFGADAIALRTETEEWFSIRRIGLRLPATLDARLTDEIDPNDPELQSALLAGLNRALADRALAGVGFAASDADAFQTNRAALEKRFGDAIAHTGKLRIFADHGEIHFYTWGNTECCLPRGVTAATLVDKFADGTSASGAPQQQYQTPSSSELPRALHLRVGDILIFEEIVDPTTGLPADANPARRHAVLLTRVVPKLDALFDQPVVEIEWAAEDALPFPFCISVRGPADGAKPCELIENVSVARGNVLLVDHGRSIEKPDSLGKVPLETCAASCRCEGESADPVTHAGRFTPELAKAGITFAETPPPLVSAARALTQDPQRGRPSIKLTSIAGDPAGKAPLFDWDERAGTLSLAARLARAWQAHIVDPAKGDPSALHLIGQLPAGVRAWLAEPETAKADEAAPKNNLSSELGDAIKSFVTGWTPRFDLLESEPDEWHFVVEMDETRKVHLRFGFDGMGQTLRAGEIFSAEYRIGNGVAGNVGADKITELFPAPNGVHIDVRNPLPASGGIEPESLEEVRRNAPFVFHRQLERAITEEDYTALAMQCPHAKIQRAATDLRWTGSRHLARVAVDPFGRETASAELLQTIKTWLLPRRRIGHDVEVVTATLVPLHITLQVCVRPHFQPAHVKRALLEIFGSGLRPNGDKGFFHPDQLTFGEPIRLSTIVAESQAVPGVASVEVSTLQRLFSPPNHELEDGLLPLGPLEIAQLDNDPTFPENGVLTIEIGGLS